MESMTTNIYVRFGLQCLINVELGLRLSWILNKTHPALGRVIYLFVLPNVMYLLPKWSINSE